ncbi:hypothetical protein LIER_41658 [Lithospermum erythrorhizon]|uniref:F-box associated beta-propeller type 3 domain-containing protein n=1 Tax=Lithospermum erythrorhizon TaxID=34254 RepID=A0AAV3RIF9_LITER
MLSSDTLDTNGIWYCGFGHDDNDDYKVIVIRYSCESPGSPFKSDFSHVYSLKTNSWKEVERCPYSIYGFMMNIAVITACGAIHFIAYENEDMIASFDLAKEEYRVVPKPDVNIADDALVTLSLGTLGGRLCLTYKEYRFVFHDIIDAQFFVILNVEHLMDLVFIHVNDQPRNLLASQLHQTRDVQVIRSLYNQKI